MPRCRQTGTQGGQSVQAHTRMRERGGQGGGEGGETIKDSKTIRDSKAITYLPWQDWLQWPGRLQSCIGRAGRLQSCIGQEGSQGRVRGSSTIK